MVSGSLLPCFGPSSLGDVPFGLGPLARLSVDLSAKPIRPGTFRIEPNGLGETLDSLVVFIVFQAPDALLDGLGSLQAFSFTRQALPGLYSH